MITASPESLAIVGAGPVGLEAAAAALESGLDVHVFERGEPGAHVRAWGHVRAFTPWRTLVGPASARLLARNGWTAPDPEALPTGAEFADRVLEPLAATPELRGRVHALARVEHVGRRGVVPGEIADAAERRTHPFRLVVRDAGGRENLLHARAVIDASGVLGSPNRAGTGGIPARGEAYLAPQLGTGCVDVRGLRRARHAGRATLVIGGGATAASNVTELAALASEAEGTRVAWATRASGGPLAGEADGDPWPARAALFAAARALRDGSDPNVAWRGGVEVEGFEFNSATHRFRVALAGASGTHLEEADEVIVCTGFAPDHAMIRTLHVPVCARTLAPRALAQALQKGHAVDAAALANPEPDFWILGARSYGRRRGFTLADGWAQVAIALEAISAAG